MFFPAVLSTGEMPRKSFPSSAEDSPRRASPAVARASSASSSASSAIAETPRHGWQLGFVSQEDEYIAPTPLKPLSGTLPRDLNGTFFRNGPGRFDVYGERLSHWFDGDGKIAKIDIKDGAATYQSRFVNTARKRYEDRAQQRLYQGFGRTPRGGFFGKLLGRGDMNNANTNVIFQGGKLLALQEGGLPHRLDIDSLRTVGLDNLRGLPGNANYTAHPKPYKDGMWGFAVSYGRQNMVRTYFTDAEGKTTPKGTWEMPFPGLVHDFAITETRAVFVMPPWTMDPFPWRFLMALESMDKLLKWTPELGTRIVTMDLQSGATTFATTGPSLLFHTVNAWDNEDGGITLDACSMPDGSGLSVPVDVMLGKAPDHHMPTVRRIRLDAGGQVLSNAALFATQMDFPKIASRMLSHPHRHVWGVEWPRDKAFLGHPVHIDLAAGKIDVAQLEREEYASECALAPKFEAVAEEDAYLLTVVLNAAEKRSELHVYDAANLAGGPLCRQELPQIVPQGFHGNWLPRDGQQAIA